MAYATLEDVQARYHLPIEESLHNLVESRLEDAENKIRVRIPALDERIAQGRVAESTVIRVTADAVIRLLRNPEGFISETDGNYTYQRGQTDGASDLTIPADDWRDLGVRKGMRTIQPSLELPWEAAQ